MSLKSVVVGSAESLPSIAVAGAVAKPAVSSADSGKAAAEANVNDLSAFPGQTVLVGGDPPVTESSSSGTSDPPVGCLPSAVDEVATCEATAASVRL
ncbi:hypothetical protein GGF41_001566 [Coemansia sp. RSA 2531]|nr:hypothetical protein GGF41_001566 [Coemansia sp. RSA 2531]